jgi:hypothetical protein
MTYSRSPRLEVHGRRRPDAPLRERPQAAPQVPGRGARCLLEHRGAGRDALVAGRRLLGPAGGVGTVGPTGHPERRAISRFAAAG